MDKIKHNKTEQAQQIQIWTEKSRLFWTDGLTEAIIMVYRRGKEEGEGGHSESYLSPATKRNSPFLASLAKKGGEKRIQKRKIIISLIF